MGNEYDRSHFRTIAGSEKHPLSPNVTDVIATMQQRQSWMRDYLLEEGADPLPFIGSVKLTDTDVKVAAKIREALGLTESWANEQQNWEVALGHLITVSEYAGIMVFRESVVGSNNKRKLDVSEFRGFVLNDEFAPLIFLNGNDGKAAQMFTLAHEIAHLFLGKSAIFDLINLEPADDPYERKSNSIAAEFLVPASKLLKMRNEPIQKIAKTFKVSELVASYRMLNVNIISTCEFDDFYTQYVEKREKERDKTQGKSGGPDYYVVKKSQLSQIFSFAVIHAAKEGTLLYRDAYNLIGMHGSSFEKYAQHLGCE
jgi:Zn-dependent peptidase ImmA (M78 family)